MRHACSSLAAACTAVVVFATLLAAPACSDSSSGPSSSGSSAGSGSVTQTIGPEGGKIDVQGATVTFPKGALAAPTEITISASDATAPDGFVALSKIFKCGPTGTDFAQDVIMQMPFTADGKPATMFWSAGGDPTFKDVGGKIEGTNMIANVKHFSDGFVGYKK